MHMIKCSMISYLIHMISYDYDIMYSEYDIMNDIVFIYNYIKDDIYTFYTSYLI
jgi:hypothetical protein